VNKTNLQVVFTKINGYQVRRLAALDKKTINEIIRIFSKEISKVFELNRRA
jgi:hypothetical protein